MSENRNPLDSLNKKRAIKRLADDLADFDHRTSSIISPVESEMLSLIINDALSGIDISKRYPTFYKKILSNPGLRQAFIDSLEIIEKSQENGLVALPNESKPDLAFLSRLSIRPGKLTLNKNRWQIGWQRTIEQLQTTFFPAGLESAYRRDPSLVDDTWFTLIRETIDVKGVSYSVLLECGISENVENSLSAFLSVAVTLESNTISSQFPIFVTLHWGKYNETIEITEQGRVRFPDVLFTMAFDKNLQNITSELNLILEKGPWLQNHEPR